MTRSQQKSTGILLRVALMDFPSHKSNIIILIAAILCLILASVILYLTLTTVSEKMDLLLEKTDVLTTEFQSFNESMSVIADFFAELDARITQLEDNMEAASVLRDMLPFGR